jgi:NDP-sugar pyrophosphorylase family protein
MQNVFDNALVVGNAQVFGYAVVSGTAQVRGNARVSGNARVRGYAVVSGHTRISGNAEIFEPGHVVVIDGLFEDSPITLHRTVGGGHQVNVGCQIFSLDYDLQALADEHGWTLPVGWTILRDFLKVRAAQWSA